MVNTSMGLRFKVAAVVVARPGQWDLYSSQNCASHQTWSHRSSSLGRAPGWEDGGGHEQNVLGCQTPGQCPLSKPLLHWHLSPDLLLAHAAGAGANCQHRDRVERGKVSLRVKGGVTRRMGLWALGFAPQRALAGARFRFTAG